MLSAAFARLQKLPHTSQLRMALMFMFFPVKPPPYRNKQAKEFLETMHYNYNTTISLLFAFALSEADLVLSKDT